MLFDPERVHGYFSLRRVTTSPIKTALTTRGTNQSSVGSSLWVGTVGFSMAEFGLTTAAAKIAVLILCPLASFSRNSENHGLQSSIGVASGIIKAVARCAMAVLDKSGIGPGI